MPQPIEIGLIVRTIQIIQPKPGDMNALTYLLNSTNIQAENLRNSEIHSHKQTKQWQKYKFQRIICKKITAHGLVRSTFAFVFAEDKMIIHFS